MNNTSSRLDESLSIREGQLYFDNCKLSEVAKKYGTPLFVVSETQLRNNIRRFQKAFQERWKEGPVDILPAIKANWISALRRILTQEGAGCDVFSFGELQVALKSGANPEKISVNGGGKSEELIRECINKGVRITIDDTDELDIINRVAESLQKVAQIRFRIRPEIPKAYYMSDFALETIPVDIGFQVYKSGVPSEHLIELGKRALKMKNIELMGFHVHLGRHHSSLKVWNHLMDQYTELIALLKKEWGGYEPKEIDIGGGFPCPRDPFRKMLVRWEIAVFPLVWLFSNLLHLAGNKVRYKLISFFAVVFGKSPNKRQAPTIEEYAEIITSALRRGFSARGINTSGLRLQIEPGRSLYGNIGVHLTKVIKVKKQTTPIPWNWVLLDTTYFFLSSGVLEYNLHDFRVANKASEPCTFKADLVGKSCFADRILPEVRLPVVEPNDIVAVLDTGAYQEVSASNFNALCRPATVLVNGSSSELIKRAETFDEVVSRDIVPERLL